MSDPEPTTIEEAIDEVAKGPKEMTIAGMGHTVEHDLPDLIDAAKFVGPSAAIKKRVGGGMKFTIATPGGSA